MGGRGAGDRVDKSLPQKSPFTVGLLGPSSRHSFSLCFQSAMLPHVLGWTLLGSMWEGVDGAIDELRF